MECDKYHRVVQTQAFAEEAHALASCLHDWWHVSPSLTPVDNAFRLKNMDYVKSLFMLGLICIIILAVKLLMLFIYLMVKLYGAQSYVYRYDCIIELKRSVVNMAIFCMCFSFIGVLANMTFFFSVKRFYDEFFRIYQVFKNVDVENSKMNYTIGMLKEKAIETKKLTNVPEITTLIQDIIHLSEDAIISIAKMMAHTKEIYLDSYLKKFWNWYGAACQGGIGGWLCGLMLCILIIAAAKSRARGALLILAAVTLNALIATWCATAMLLTVAVGISDACFEPAAAIANNMPFSPNMSAKEVFYYTDCPTLEEDEDPPKIVLKEELEYLHNILIKMRINIDELLTGQDRTAKKDRDKLADDFHIMLSNIHDSEQYHLEAHLLLSCQYTRRYFSQGMRAICEVGLKATLVQMLASIASSCMYTMILATYISTKRPNKAVYK